MFLVKVESDNTKVYLDDHEYIIIHPNETKEILNEDEGIPKYGKLVAEHPDGNVLEEIIDGTAKYFDVDQTTGEKSYIDGLFKIDAEGSWYYKEDEDGCAYFTVDYTEKIYRYYNKEGELHRVDKPAVLNIGTPGKNEYWEEGVQIPKKYGDLPIEMFENIYDTIPCEVHDLRVMFSVALRELKRYDEKTRQLVQKIRELVK